MKKVCACVLFAIILLVGCGDNAGMQNLYSAEFEITRTDSETDFFWQRHGMPGLRRYINRSLIPFPWQRIRCILWTEQRECLQVCMGYL